MPKGKDTEQDQAKVDHSLPVHDPVEEELPDRHALAIVDFGRGAQPAVDPRSKKVVPDLPPADRGATDVSGVSNPVPQTKGRE